MKKIQTVQLQVTIVNEDYSSNYAVIDFPAFAGQELIADAMRASVGLLVEVAVSKREDSIENERLQAIEKAAKEETVNA